MLLRLFHTSRNLFITAAIAAIFPGGVFVANGQQPSSPPPDGGSAATPQQSGSATAGTFAPVLDSEKRPITAGGFVKEGPIVFQDVSEKAGLTSGITRWERRKRTTS
jgi:hypothetical protein